MPGWALCLCGCVLLGGFACARPASEPAIESAQSAVYDHLADTRATAHHWQQARDYERQMRYELARQQYLLALAACRSAPTQEQLRRELESVDLQIRTMR